MLRRRAMLVALLICSLAGCGKSQPPQAVTVTLPGVDDSKDEQQFKANRIRPGETLAFGNLKISDVAVAPAGVKCIVSAKIANTSKNKVFAAVSYVVNSHDEHGNKLDAPGMFDIDHSDMKALEERMRDLQPGESKTIFFNVGRKLKSAKHGTLNLGSQQGDDVDEAKWTLEFDFP